MLYMVELHGFYKLFSMVGMNYALPKNDTFLTGNNKCLQVLNQEEHV